MKTFLEAIYTAFLGEDGGTLRNLVKGMFPNEAPQELLRPYVTYALISSPTDWTFTTHDDMPLVQFSVWDDDPAPDRCLEIMDAVFDLYNDKLLEIEGCSTLRADVINQFKTKDISEGWHGVVEVRYIVERTR